MKQKKLIGHTSEKRTIELERNDIRNFASAMGSQNPIHFDVAAAKKAGYPNLVAPNAMASTFGSHASLVALFELNPKNVLHSLQSMELRRPLCAGDTFTVFSVISDVQERPAAGSDTTGFITVDDEGSDDRGKPLFLARRVLAVRGGFPRR